MPIYLVQFDLLEDSPSRLNLNLDGSGLCDLNSRSQTIVEGGRLQDAQAQFHFPPRDSREVWNWLKISLSPLAKLLGHQPNVCPGSRLKEATDMREWQSAGEIEVQGQTL